MGHESNKLICGARSSKGQRRNKLIQNVIRIENMYLYLKDSRCLSPMPQRTRKRTAGWGGVG